MGQRFTKARVDISNVRNDFYEIAEDYMAKTRVCIQIVIPVSPQVLSSNLNSSVLQM